MTDDNRTEEHDAEEAAAIIATVAGEILPRLVEVLQDCEPPYRMRMVRAALALFGETL